MTKKGLFGLALATGLVVFLAVLYVYYPRVVPQVAPGKPQPPGEIQYRTAQEFAEKPASPVAGAPPSQEPPPSPSATAAPAQPAAPPAPPEVKAPKTPQPPTEPEEHYGLLVGRYRTYRQARKVMEKLQKEGKPAFVRHDGRQRKPYAVWAGPYSSQEETKVAAASLRKQLKISPKPEKLDLPVPK